MSEIWRETIRISTVARVMYITTVRYEEFRIYRVLYRGVFYVLLKIGWLAMHIS